MLISAVALNKAHSTLLGLFRRTPNDEQAPEAAGECRSVAAHSLSLVQGLADRKSVLWPADEKLDDRAVLTRRLAQMRVGVIERKLSSKVQFN